MRAFRTHRSARHHRGDHLLRGGHGGPATLANITVEGGEQPEGAVSDKAVVAVTKQTAIIDAGRSADRRSSAEVGTEVKVWFTGPVAESYPVQGAASRSRLLGRSQ